MSSKSNGSRPGKGGASTPPTSDTETTPLKKDFPSPTSSAPSSSIGTGDVLTIASAASFTTSSSSSSFTSNSTSTSSQALTPLLAQKMNAQTPPPKTLVDRFWDFVHIPNKIFITLYLFATALMMNVIQATGLLLLGGVSKYWYRWWIEKAAYWYGGFLVAILELWSGLRPIYYGDIAFMSSPVTPPNVIYISNHTSYTDWVVFFGTAIRKHANQFMKIFLKDVACLIPGIGWSTYLGDYFLVKKSKSKGAWERDGKVIVDRLKSYTQTKNPIWATIFPEGTFHDGADEQLVERTKAFARENNLPVFDYLLTPRPRGFVACVQNLRGYATHVVDLTITFLGTRDKSPHVKTFVTALPVDDMTRVLPDASDLCSFRGPANVHIHVKVHKLEDVPTDEEGIKAWIYNVWVEKDALLKHFHHHGSFPGPSKPLDITWFGGGAKSWMIQFPVFWATVTYACYRLVTALPPTALTYMGIIVFSIATLGLITDRMCKGR